MNSMRLRKLSLSLSDSMNNLSAITHGSPVYLRKVILDIPLSGFDDLLDRVCSLSYFVDVLEIWDARSIFNFFIYKEFVIEFDSVVFVVELKGDSCFFVRYGSHSY